MIRILRAADRVAVPWKNGGGITREVAAWPEGSGFDDFDWRTSIAEVREAGPFSKFENIDRTMMILSGRLSLAFADRNVRLDSDSAPFAFPGDVACSGKPLDGDVMDLNVMTRRGRCSARMERLFASSLSDCENQTLVVARTTSTIAINAQQIALDPRDTVLIEGRAAVRMISGTGFLIAIAGQ